MARRSHDPSAPGESLWAMIVSPTIWAAHFLACYIVAAIFCAKADAPSADLGTVRMWVAGFTMLALAGIAVSGIQAFRLGHFMEGEAAPHDADTIQDRRRFLAYATLLLSGLSFVATLFVALPAVFVASCR
ncbi:MAG: hypothetical protein ACREH3_14390 [Geminicoccales bacterium]